MGVSAVKQDKLALEAAWQAQPQVIAFTAAVAEHAAANPQLQFTAEGVTNVLQFAIAWLAENGDLPDSGIICG